MTVAPKPHFRVPSGSVDGRGSVRRAAPVPRPGGREGDKPSAPVRSAAGAPASEARTLARCGGLAALRHSPLARRIVAFNLVALVLLVAGMLCLMPSRDALTPQSEDILASEVLLVARVVEARRASSAVLDGAALVGLDLRPGTSAVLLDGDGRLVATATGPKEGDAQARPSGLGGEQASDAIPAELEEVRTTAVRALAENAVAVDAGKAVLTAAAPIRQEGRTVGVVALRTVGEWAGAQVLPLLVLAVAVSVGLSLVLASTIANPLADLVTAAEAGQSRDARSLSPGRVRIPDLSDRPDEIGRLSAALRGMVAALYDRIDLNEQFAADVAHEIKNPLASLRSAVGTLRVARREDQREALLGIIEHDVRRLDRLVSDISSASRLDSDLVKEEEAPFDLIALLSSLTEYLAHEAEDRGIDLFTDLPREPVVVRGLEARLAQVVVNVVGNAISLCEEGDAVRVWVRRREARVLVVVEDTGPGIPEEALSRIFERFYSQRPEGQFGNNSGLGLAISKQIVEAHGGVIWAENIHPTDLDPTSEPMGARFVVGLPV